MAAKAARTIVLGDREWTRIDTDDDESLIVSLPPQNLRYGDIVYIAVGHYTQTDVDDGELEGSRAFLSLDSEGLWTIAGIEREGTITIWARWAGRQYDNTNDMYIVVV